MNGSYKGQDCTCTITIEHNLGHTQEADGSLTVGTFNTNNCLWNCYGIVISFDIICNLVEHLICLLQS